MDFGYETSFYHGGNDGTMGFDKYTKVAGFDECHENEFFSAVMKRHLMGLWGIPDEPFFDFFRR